MRILHVTRSIDPVAGGPPVVVVGLAAAQAAQGHEVTILQDDARCDRERLSLLLEQLHATESVRVVNLADEGTSLNVRLSHLAPDFIHIHGVWCSLVRRIIAAASSKKLPFCIAPHGTLGPWSLRQKALKKRVALGLIYGRLLRKSRFLSINNGAEMKFVSELGLHDHIEYLPNGLGDEEVERQPDADEFVRKYRAGNSRPFVLFLSRLAYQKAPELLLRGFASVSERIPEYDLVLAGPDGGLEEEVREVLAELPSEVRARVQMVGPIYGEQKYAAYRACALFCLPSRYESFGMVIVEAMAAGAPLLVSDTCYFPMIEESGIGATCRAEAASIAEGLERVLGRQQLLETARERGPELVRTHFLWSKIAKDSVELYERYR